MAIRISVQLTVPKEILNPQNVIDEIAKTQRNKTAPDVKRLFKQTVEGWQNPPIFIHRQQIARREIGVTISATGSHIGLHGLTAADQYSLVNAGADPHPIPTPGTTARGGFLRFQRGYHSSTRPRVLSSRAYMRYGPYSAALSVDHRGFKAREFDQEIAEQYEDTFQNDMQDAVNRGAHMP